MKCLAWIMGITTSLALGVPSSSIVQTQDAAITAISWTARAGRSGCHDTATTNQVRAVVQTDDVLGTTKNSDSSCDEQATIARAGGAHTAKLDAAVDGNITTPRTDNAVHTCTARCGSDTRAGDTGRDPAANAAFGARLGVGRSDGCPPIASDRDTSGTVPSRTGDGILRVPSTGDVSPLSTGGNTTPPPAGDHTAPPSDEGRAAPPIAGSMLPLPSEDSVPALVREQPDQADHTLTTSGRGTRAARVHRVDVAFDLQQALPHTGSLPGPPVQVALFVLGLCSLVAGVVIKWRNRSSARLKPNQADVGHSQVTQLDQQAELVLTRSALIAAGAIGEPPPSLADHTPTTSVRGTRAARVHRVDVAFDLQQALPHTGNLPRSPGEVALAIFGLCSLVRVVIEWPRRFASKDPLRSGCTGRSPPLPWSYQVRHNVVLFRPEAA